jgi:hypothetical protein
MAYDFHKLKTIECGNILNLRVPERWIVEQDNETNWCCYEKGNDSGTLWISIDYMSGPAENPDFDSRRFVEEIAEGSTDSVESVVLDLRDGHVWKNVYDDEDKDGALRSFRYSIFQFRGNQGAIIVCNLVLPFPQVDEPEFRELTEIMDREIREASITAFSDKHSFLSPVHRAVFGDQVKIVLPVAMKFQASNEQPNKWFGDFEPETVEACICVMSKEHVLADEDTEELISIKPESYVKVASDFVFGDGILSLADHGVISYVAQDIIDEYAVKDWKTDRVRSHLWQYFRFGHGKLRQVHVVMTAPIDRAERSDILAFRDFLDTHFRRASFPGME